MGLLGTIRNGIKHLGAGLKKAVSLGRTGVGKVKHLGARIGHFLGEIPVVGGILKESAEKLINTPIVGKHSVSSIINKADEILTTADDALDGKEDAKKKIYDELRQIAKKGLMRPR